MVCKHLAELERALLQSEIAETFHGAAWSRNCREWVYFRCVLNREKLRSLFHFAPCVRDREHLGTHDGSEAGFVCELCRDAVMGAHPLHRAGWPEFE